MKLGFPSSQRAVGAREISLLELLSELVDANADTVELLTGHERSELEWLAQCDYLRALQRLGSETLARHDQRASSGLGLAGVSGLNGAVARGWLAAVVALCGPARALMHYCPAPIIARR